VKAGRLIGIGRAESLDALPALLSFAREVVAAVCEAGDAEGEELRGLLEACVVGAHRLRLRERLQDEPPGCRR